MVEYKVVKSARQTTSHTICYYFIYYKKVGGKKHGKKNENHGR